MNKRTKKTFAVWFAIIIVLAAFILWLNGAFCIVDRQASPNGKIITTVYSKNLMGLMPKDDGFTIKTGGDFKGQRIYKDGAEFEQLWWSPDSNYQVISTMYESERLMELKSYAHNSVTNLSLIINMNMSNYTEFTELMRDETDWRTLQLNFVEWKEEKGSMTVDFVFTDYKNNEQNGKLDYDFETGEISNITFI